MNYIDSNDSDNGKNETWVLLPSKIHGLGVFSRKWLQQGEKIAKGITFYMGVFPVVSFMGSKINHSYNPSAVLRYNPSEKVYNVYSAYNLTPGTEITIDYNDTPSYISGPESHYK